MSEPARNLPEHIDERLWIRTKACADRDYLWGNPHTFPGRMEAYCPHLDRDFSVSKSELRQASPEALLWISGYLRGTEPPPPPEDDAEYEQTWVHAIEAFHRTGTWTRPE